MAAAAAAAEVFCVYSFVVCFIKIGRLVPLSATGLACLPRSATACLQQAVRNSHCCLVLCLGNANRQCLI